VSPVTHGLVALSLPRCGVGFFLFTSSIKTSPGSPVFHAISTIRSKIGLFPLTASVMNSSVAATEMLKLCSLPSSVLALMNLTISGWSQLSIPMFAPRLIPPCCTISVARLKSSMKDTGPEALPLVD